MSLALQTTTEKQKHPAHGARPKFALQIPQKSPHRQRRAVPQGPATLRAKGHLRPIAICIGETSFLPLLSLESQTRALCPMTALLRIQPVVGLVLFSRLLLQLAFLFRSRLGEPPTPRI